jgi:hypothetical protein
MMALKDRWVFFIFLLLILFTLFVARGEGIVDENAAPHSGMKPPVRFSRDAGMNKAVGVKSSVGDRSSWSLLLTPWETGEENVDRTSENARP